MGQYAAACFAGLFDLEDALSLVVERARLLSDDEDPQQLVSFERSGTEKISTTPKIRMLTTSDQDASAEVTSPEYWIEALKSTPLPSDFVEPLGQEICDLYLEIGPGRSITQSLEAEFPGKCLSSLQQERGDWEQLLESLARLYVSGATVDWSGFERGYSRQRVILPTYPFQRKRYWISDAESKTSDDPGTSLPDTYDMMRAKQHDSWQVGSYLDEVEKLSDVEVMMHLHQFESDDQNQDQLTVLEEIRLRLGDMSASRQALLIKMLDLNLQRQRTNNTNGSGMSHEVRITDTELDQLSESEAEALLLKKLESLKF